jgi:UDP-N-acetylmuramoyl-tripeptide--D-alanyl-D-alanine ligase
MDWNFLIRNKESIHVTTDSRKVTSGSIFVALKGEHFDGNDFVDQARKDGAAYVICGENALRDLQDLARAWRRELGLPILGITGTNGKTTTKELCAAVLSTKYNLYYTQGNLNNQIGVPLTLLSITRAHEMAIVEMGASHPGDIKELVEIAEPNFGLITNVGRAHLEGFGSFEGVMRTKAELYDFLIAHNGIIFRNADNPHLKEMLGNHLGSLESLGHLVSYTTGTMPEGTHLVGGYNAENVSAALCVGEFFGVSREAGLAAIRAYIPSNNRSQLMQTERNTVVVDAYNANPTSMHAALDNFSLIQADKKMVILGQMGELGEESDKEHRLLVDRLQSAGYDDVWLVGDNFKDIDCPFRKFHDTEEVKAAIKEHCPEGFYILIKGSNSNKLFQLPELL